MKSIFFLALRQLKKWEEEKTPKAEIEAALAQNDAGSQKMKTPVSGFFIMEREKQHQTWSEIYYSQKQRIEQIEDCLELPTKSLGGGDLSEDLKLGENQMRWGALKLISYSLQGEKLATDDFPYKSVKHKVGKLYDLCIPASKLTWDLVLVEGTMKRKGFERIFTSEDDLNTVREIMNNVIFISYGLGDEIKIAISAENSKKLEAFGDANFPMCEVLRVEEGWRSREKAIKGK